MVNILLEVPCLCDIFQVKAETDQFLDGPWYCTNGKEFPLNDEIAVYPS